MGFFAALLAFIFSLLVFRFSGIFFNPIVPVLSLVTAVIIREIIFQTASDREKQFIRKAFSTYVSDDVVQDVSLAIGSPRFGATWCLHFEESAHVTVSFVMMI
jgi:ABC-type branched-subunit amino acid transport system permease subunit